jgi:hypothetical protein
MKTVVLMAALGFLSSLLFGQENVQFKDVTSGDYDNGFLYIEVKTYPNNKKLIEESKNKTRELPVITKEKINNEIYYSFTGYVIGDENDIEIMRVKIKFTNDERINNINRLLNGFGLSINDIKELLENIDDDEEFIADTGKDNYGEYAVHRNLLFDDSDEIEDGFKIYYAMIVLLNIADINQEDLSRDLLNYLMMIR